MLMLTGVDSKIEIKLVIYARHSKIGYGFKALEGPTH